MNRVLKAGLKSFGIGVFCAFLFILAQVATYTTTAQIPSVGPGGTFNLLSDSLAMAFNVDSHGTRNWFVRPFAVVPIVTGDWTTIGTGGTRTNGANWINVVGTTGGTGNVYGVSHTVAAGDFTHLFLVYGQINLTSNSTIAVGFTDGTAVESCGLIWITTTGPQFNTTKTTALSSGTYSAANGQIFSVTNEYGSFLPMYVKLNRSGTTLSCSLSFDGALSYETFFTDSIPALTASSVLAYSDPRSSANPARFTLISYQ